MKPIRPRKKMEQRGLKVRARGYYFLCLIICGVVIQLATQETIAATEKKAAKKIEQKQLYIGIESRRMPYSDVNDAQKAQGILVDATKQVCKKMNANCRFINDNFSSLLQQLATRQLHAVINIDTVVLPKIDKLKLSPPLCRITPVFIQHQSSQKKTSTDFKNTTIGVLEGSSLHFYLLDHYSRFARLRAYPVLENGVFDLVSGRIDALYADNAFFQYRVASTSLARDMTPPTLVAHPIEDAKQEKPEKSEEREKLEKQPSLASISMAFILRENDDELFTLLEKALAAQKQPPDCASLLSANKQKQAKLKQPTSKKEAEK